MIAVKTYGTSLCIYAKALSVSTYQIIILLLTYLGF